MYGTALGFPITAKCWSGSLSVSFGWTVRQSWVLVPARRYSPRKWGTLSFLFPKPWYCVNAHTFLRNFHALRECLIKSLDNHFHSIIGSFTCVDTRWSPLRNEVLVKFFKFVKEKLNKPEILNKEWIKLANDLKNHRNRASHSERYSLEEAEEVKEITLKLLKAF